MMRTRSIWFLAPCAFLIGCTDTQPVERGSAVALSTDQRGIPRMLQATGMPAAPAATAMESARTHVERLAGQWGVAPGMLPALDALGEVRVRGGTIARMRQVVDDMPVWGRELRVLVRPGGELAMVSGSLVSSATPRAPARFNKDEGGAIAGAVERTYGTQAGVHVDEAKAARVWYPQDGHLVAAWVVDAFTSPTGSTNAVAHRTILTGDTGRVLEHYSLTADADFQYNVFAETTGEKHPLDGPIVDATPHPTGVPDGFYPAYLAGPSLVTVDGLNTHGDSWLAPGATETNGNNVDAYVDINSPSGLSAGDFRADVTEPGRFGHAYNPLLGPMETVEQQKAGITSLFYVINWLHDFWYDAGFTETAGNGQKLNYGRGGVEGDAILAEAQDNANGGSRNNANMSTPSDGMSPRMQVFLWSGKEERKLQLANRTVTVGTASFGPAGFDTSGSLELGTDSGGASANDGCEALTSDVTGKIAIVDRGTCTFKTKALNVQNAGGIAMVLVNNAAGVPPGMGDDATITTPITIPVLSVTQADGAALRADVQAGQNAATLFRKQFQELDGSLDSTLIAHEFGHYLHHRLSLCGNAQCRAMSEGWGDFLALMLLARPGDDLDGAYPFSVYTTQSFSGDPAYFGIRRAPYSVDTSINSLTYRYMADGVAAPTSHPFRASGVNSEVHNAGEVWAAALWEVYIALQKAGSDFVAVRAKMAEYVVAGLLLTPTEATPMEVRDALLAAALAANNQADHDLMIAAFARRGFGSCAKAPTLNTFTDLVESKIVAGTAALEAIAIEDGCDKDGVLDANETAKVKVRLTNKGHAAITNVRLALSSDIPGLTVVSQPAAIATLAQKASTDLEVEVKLADAVAPIAGTLSLEILADGACEESLDVPVSFRVNVDEVAEKAANDTFDTDLSVWDASTSAWSHVRDSALDGAWHGDDASAPTDTSLTSPLLTASETERLTITFQHKFSFERSGNTYWDGGVIEYSIDDGATWEDISALANPGYVGTLSAQANNPLGNRMGYGGNSRAWPEYEPVSLDIGTALAGKQFRIRFRIGTDDNTGAAGWSVDEIAFSGIVGTPFPAQVADNGLCGPQDPGGDDDDDLDPVGEASGCCSAGPLRGANLGLALCVLALVMRRRRKH